MTSVVQAYADPARGPRAEGAEPAVAMESVGKRFGAFAAVSDVSLTIAPGEVHALVGANGAGKSTLLGLLSGRERLSEGRIHVFGHRLETGKPRRSRALGIATVYQELTILPALDACANVFLGDERARGGVLSRRTMRRRYAELAGEFGIDVPPGARAGELSLASQQMLEIVRAVQQRARLLLLDEPTAALSLTERERLLSVIGRLKHAGVTVVIVTHNLDEVLAVSDRITVMRNGRIVRTADKADWTKPMLVREMIGEEEAQVIEEIVRHPIDGPVALKAEVTLDAHRAPIPLEVRAGEVLGIAGLVGSGRTSLFCALAGARRASGWVEVRGARRRLPRSPREAMKLGIGHLPEDRKTEGLILGMSIGDNVTLSRLGRISRAGFVARAVQRSIATRSLAPFVLQRPVGEYPVGDLSGGGQQKVLFARLLFEDPDVFIIDEPTRGIDVSAKAEVLKEIRGLAEAGKAIILTSSEIDEVIDVSDRVLVMSERELRGQLTYTDGMPTSRQVLDVAFGVHGSQEREST